ncbi:hypothetical protein BC830DRAFT_1088461 [Chytriomyces sp. MP71]|nr:hypothetical protein BC830DRAFT_1088461 [Chytriomyces sp. MP71]
MRSRFLMFTAHLLALEVLAFMTSNHTLIFISNLPRGINGDTKPNYGIMRMHGWLKYHFSCI